MASLVLSGDTSGSITVSAPAIAGSTTQTLVNVSGTLAPVVSGTAVTASGTSVEFTNLPPWIKRLTVMFSGISTSPTQTSIAQVQIGSGSFTTSNYASTVIGGANANSITATANTGGFVILGQAFAAANAYNGVVQLLNISGNTWVAFGGTSISGSNTGYTVTGSVAIGGTLDRVRMTMVNGTDTFDAGTINIIYE
jgi:hypothetical protein